MDRRSRYKHPAIRTKQDIKETAKLENNATFLTKCFVWEKMCLEYIVILHKYVIYVIV